MKTIIALPDNYTILDLETTGLDFHYDDIIEIAAIRYRNGLETARFSQLVSVGYSLPPIISEITGISDEMLLGCPTIREVLPKICDFLGDDIIIGHNICFDMHFVNYAASMYLGKEISNKCIDTMRLSRKLLPGLSHYRLADVAIQVGYEQLMAHRSTDDCVTTNAVYASLKGLALSEGSEEDFINKFEPAGKIAYKKINAKDIEATTEYFDETHPFFGKVVVFTGALSKMTRAAAMQFVVNLGGSCGNGITKATNYLVVGTSDYISTKEGKKTAKMAKVDDLRTKGFDIATISEETFYDLISG